MRNWLRHNILGVALVAVGTLTYGATVGYPAWKEGLGSDVPAATVPAGATVRIDGVLWRMRVLEMPPPEYTRYDDPQPPGTRFVSYAFDRSRDGRPAPLGEEWGACRATFVDQNYRHWYGQSGLLPMSVSQWLRKQGYDTCNTPGSFAAVMVVPRDADITAVDVEFSPAKGSGKKYRYVRFTPPA
ncbi:hypothetical protein [Mycobacteroides abscessus]|uniref:hypothetical protein n=1 Tax=Mycobacteroides abscessus TaxID=36809 RepID=UPI0021078694|nr:hypothetical protein [Mycobacteroides abscessus]